MKEKANLIIKLTLLIIFLSNILLTSISLAVTNKTDINITNQTKNEESVKNNIIENSGNTITNEDAEVKNIEIEQNKEELNAKVEEKNKTEEKKESEVEKNNGTEEKNEKEENNNDVEKNDKTEVINNDIQEEKKTVEKIDEIKENTIQELKENEQEIKEVEKEKIDMPQIMTSVKSNMVEEGTYIISTALDSNMVLDIYEASMYEGANIEIYQNKNGNNQKFKLKKSDDGYYTIESCGSGLVLSVQDSRTDNCTNVFQCQYKGLDSQKWKIENADNGYYYIVSKHSKLYLDVQGGKSYNCANICIFEGHNGIGQKFKFTKVEYQAGEKTIEDGTYSISTSLNSRYGLDVTARSQVNEANIELWELSEKNHQRFDIKYLGDGTYTIQAIHSGKYLTVSNSKKASGTNVEQNTYKDIDAQKWYIQSAGNGYYYVVSKCNNLYLTVDGKATNGTNINVKDQNKNNVQKFKFNKIETVLGKQTIENGVYSISSKLNSNFAIDINYSSMENNSNAQLFQYKNVGNNQKFRVKYIEDGTYTIEAVCSSKLLTVYDSLYLNGTNVIQYENNNLNSQKWVIKEAENGYYYVISKCNNLYLNVDGRAENCVNVNVKKFNNTNSQKFKFTKEQDNSVIGNKTIEDGNYEIHSYLDNNKVLDITKADIVNGVNVELFSKNNRNNQKFKISYLGDGYYKIDVLHSNKVLTVTRSLTIEGANVEQREYVGADSQKWVIKSAENNYYYLISKCNGLALCIEDGKAYDGANIVTKALKNSKPQKFMFTKADYYKYMDENNYYIKSAINTEMVLDVTSESKEDGANIELWENKYMSHQKFKFEYLKEGTYLIKALNSNKVLTVQSSSSDESVNVEQKEYQALDTQKWEIVKSSGVYYIRSRYNGLYLNAESTDLGANINVSSLENGIENKKFIIENNQFYGIDVSQYNGNIDWKSVGQAGIDFTIIRLGFRGYRTGAIVFDPKFKENANAANANGINVGAYFVTQATNYAEGVEEANQVLAKIKEYNVKITYPIVIDIEWAGGGEGNNGRADYISVSQRTDATYGFCETIKKSGYEPMIYANKSWLKNYLNMSKLNNYDVWLAHYVTGAPSKTSDYSGKYTMWQYTSKGSVSGISGYVDIDISYKQY